MPKAIIIIIAVVIAAFLFMTPSNDEPVPGSYHNEPYGFWVKFPGGWPVEPIMDPDGLWSITAYNPDESMRAAYTTCVRVTIEDLPYKVKSDFYYERAMESIRAEFGQINVESTQDYEVGGRDGKRLVVNYNADGYPVKGLWFIVTKDKRAYLFAGMTWPQYYEQFRPLFEESLESFRLD